MSDPATVAGIARKLTKAQREALMGDPNAEMPADVAMSFIALRLIRPVLKDSFGTSVHDIGIDDVCMAWSDIGLAVRDYLERTSHDPD